MNKLELKDFLEYRFLSAPAYAPGGKAAAFVVSYSNYEENKYEGCVWVYENGKTRQLTGLAKERTFFWEDETHILFPAVRSDAEKKRADAKDKFTSYYRIDIHGGEAVHAFTLPLAVDSMEKIEGSKYLVMAGIDVNYPDYYKMSEDERKDVAKHYEEEQDYEVIDETPFWFNGAGFVNKKRNAFFIYDMETGELTRITDKLFEVDSHAILDGKVYFTGSAFQCKRPRKQEFYAYDYRTGEMECFYDGMEFSFGNVEKMGKDVIVTATRGEHFGLNENKHFYKLNQETKELELFCENTESLYSSVGSDCRLGGGKSMGQSRGKLYFTTTRRNASHIYILDDTGNMKPFVTKEGSVDSLTVDEETGKCLFVAMYGQRLQEIYEADEDGKVTQITHINEAVIKDKYVAVPEKLTVQSQGIDIDGWVLKPIDFDEKKTYPAIFDIHGGPKTVYGEVFYHEMQYWANEGYFVFFCNPTGSDGRGNEFADIRGKYGTIDYENLMDFADAVLEKYPQIDRSRVGETGGSYGGFMTNWIVGHTNRFVCAATQRSISNWVSFTGVSDIGPDFGTDQTAGDIYENIDKMWEHSPLKYVENVNTPLLFIHSNEDYRCPMEQGMQFYTALATQGNPVRMVYFKGENHELSRSGKPKHRVRRLEEITKWMDKYCKC